MYTADRGDSYASFDITAKVSFDNEQSLPCSPEDDGVKLLALFRFWNIYEYYSPNVSITKIDWDEALKQGIPKIVQTDTYPGLCPRSRRDRRPDRRRAYRCKGSGRYDRQIIMDLIPALPVSDGRRTDRRLRDV